jgi:CDP-paratose 2-epimerase
MKTILITGSGGLVGSEAVDFFINKNYRVIGIDNNSREVFFGKDGSVVDNIQSMKTNFSNYVHVELDIRDKKEIEKIFIEYNVDIEAVIHCAAQPSHDWAVNDPFMDFSINAIATIDLLELTRKYIPNSVFIYMSTNKVYGDNPNKLNLVELDTRYENLDVEYTDGINENFSIDNTKHSLFGCSKLSSDVYVQEYGKYFGMKTTVFRGGCLTGSKHNGAKLHGFLNYLVKCNLTKTKYNIFGYKGKQVRDNIHSKDLVSAFDFVINNPKCGEVYNIGGSRYSNCSILEAIKKIDNLTNIKTYYSYVEENRKGDHIWWISDVTKFKKDYPKWEYNYNLDKILTEIINNIKL